MEEALINRFIELENEIESIQLRNSSTKKSEVLNKNILIEATLKEEQRRLIIKLEALSQKSTSERILAELRIRLSEIKNRVNNLESENQLILNNSQRPMSDSITSRIIEEVGKIINLDFKQLIGPLYNVTTDKKIGIRKADLIECIENEFDIIKNLQNNINYIKIREYYSSLITRLRDLEQKNYVC